MQRIRTAFLKLATEEPSVRAIVVPLIKQAEKWEKLPKGWTEDSVKKFWGTLTGENKHKVTKCIKEMDGKLDDPGAFCASLADKVDPGWRSRRAEAHPSDKYLRGLKAADLKPPSHLKRTAPSGSYQVWLARAGEGHPYINDYPNIQVAMRHAREALTLDGVIEVAIYDSLGSLFLDSGSPEGQRMLKRASLAGTYADFVYAGDQQFLAAVAKLIKKMAGGHAERVEVVRQSGRSPFLVYEGQDGGDMNLELIIHIFPFSQSDVKVGWFGKSVMRGNISDEASFKWGELTPATVANIFSGLFGRN